MISHPADQWPTEPEPGFRPNPVDDVEIVRQMRRGVNGVKLPIEPFAPGEPLTRVCAHCRYVGRHEEDCPR